jgi:hypothetical protein
MKFGPNPPPPPPNFVSKGYSYGLICSRKTIDSLQLSVGNCCKETNKRGVGSYVIKILQITLSRQKL